MADTEQAPSADEEQQAADTAGAAPAAPDPQQPADGDDTGIKPDNTYEI